MIDAGRSDPDDNHILECAKSAGAETILTGDNHLLQLQEYEGIRITTVSEFVRRAK